MPSPKSSRDLHARIIAGAVVLLALALLPAPLLPPHRAAEVVGSILKLDWASSYLAAAIGFQVVFYLLIGILSALLFTAPSTKQQFLLELVVVPLTTVTVSLAIRSLKAGHLPLWFNAVIPMLACFFGVVLGLGYLNRRLRIAATCSGVLLVFLVWLLLRPPSSSLRAETEGRLKRLAAAEYVLPAGDARFGSLLRVVFASGASDQSTTGHIQQNRAAILALGIALGHTRLAKFLGIDPDSDVVRKAAMVCQGTTLLGREDWPRHYALSAAIAVLQNPLISDAGGVVKEQLDTLTGGSGFSFGDLAADRAGIRFAYEATRSETAARAMQLRLQNEYQVNDFFPVTMKFAENLTTQQFRRSFGAVGSQRYRAEVNRIDNALNSCAALAQQ